MTRVNARSVRRAVTLVEMVVSLAVLAIIVLTLSVSSTIALLAVETDQSPAAKTSETNHAIERFATDVRLATEITELTPTAITVRVPDRSEPPDATSELIRYEWSGVPGEPMTRQYNGGNIVGFVPDVHDPNRTLSDRRHAGSAEAGLG